MSAPLTVVTWKWKPQPGYRSTFGPETVNVLRNMVARHYPKPHRFVCVTDDPAGIQGETLPMWKEFANVISPHGKKHPSCYRRLRMFHPEIEKVFGPRFVSLDLDCVITGDLQPLWDRPEDIVLWGDTNPQPGSHYNGSMILMKAGCRPKVWTTFDPFRSPKRSLAARCFGSDQGHISYTLGKGEATWSTQDGVYSYSVHLKQTGMLPADARMVIFHGRIDPWSSFGQTIPWVQEHYC